MKWLRKSREAETKDSENEVELKTKINYSIKTRSAGLELKQVLLQYDCTC